MDWSYNGKYTKQFEEKIKRYTGTSYAIATNTGTSALYIACLLAGIKEGDEVLMPCLSFVATANVVKYLGAIPHFVDIEIDYLGLNTTKLKLYLKTLNAEQIKKIKAIMPVHLFGRICNMKEILDIAYYYNWIVIEDACQALGSWYNLNGYSYHAGTIGDIGVLSFNGNKILTTGGGGMILTDNEAIAQEAYNIIRVSKDKTKARNYHTKVGYNFAMPAINAKLGLKEFKKLRSRLKRNKRNYNKLKTKWNIFKAQDETKCNFWQQIIYSSKKPFKNAKPIYTLLPDLPMYKDCHCSDLAIARELDDKLWMVENE